jgi:hypothetical protein
MQLTTCPAAVLAGWLQEAAEAALKQGGGQQQMQDCMMSVC